MPKLQYQISTFVFREDESDYAEKRLVALYAQANDGSKTLYYLEGSVGRFELKVKEDFVPESSNDVVPESLGVVARYDVGRLNSKIRKSTFQKMLRDVIANGDSSFDRQIWVMQCLYKLADKKLITRRVAYDITEKTTSATFNGSIDPLHSASAPQDGVGTSLNQSY